jgi:hypothetical protein
MNFGRRGGLASLRRIASARLADLAGPNAVAGHERLSADECSTFVALFRFRSKHDPEKWAPVFRKDHAQTKR